MVTLVARGARRNGEESICGGIIMVCTLQGNYAEWGRGKCMWGGLLWDVWPLISLCVCKGC